MFESLVLSLAVMTAPAAVTTTDVEMYDVPKERVDSEFCRSDIDGDGLVGFTDMMIVLNLWGECPVIRPLRADIDRNQIVGLGDLLCIFCDWGTCPR